MNWSSIGNGELTEIMLEIMTSISQGEFWEVRKRAAWLTLLWQVKTFCSVLVLFPGNISFN